ncbi:MAG: AsmA family protein [Gammaproteobacteria bacterium]
MGKILRILLSVIVGLVVFVVIAAVVLPLVIDPNDYKDDITKLVEKKTGRILSINGDLGLSVFPWLAIDIGPTTLSNAEGFPAEYMAAVDEVHARVKILPLLRKEVEIGKIVLAGLKLNLETDKQGKTNWQDLQQPAEAEAEQAAETDTDIKNDESFALSTLKVDGIEITNAQVSWDDQSTSARYTLSPFSLKTSAIIPGQPVTLDMDLKLQSSEPAIAGDVSFDGVVQTNDSFSSFILNDIVLALNLTGDTLPGGKLKSTLKTSADIDLDAQTLSTRLLDLTAMNMHISGNLSGQSIMSENRSFSGDIKVDRFSPSDLMRALGQVVPVTSDNTVLSNADLKTHLEATGNKLALSGLSMHLDDTTLDGSFGISNFAKPAIRFDINLDKIDADRYLAPVSAETAPEPEVPADAPATDLPVEMLRGLNIDGGLKIGSLKAYKLRSKDIVIKLVAKNGKIQVHPASAKMYDGSYSGNIQLDVRSTPKLSIDEKLSGLQVGGLLMDMTGKDVLTGNTEAQIKLTGHGKNVAGIKKTLSGNMGFTFNDGAIKGINVISMIRQAKAAIKGKDPAEKKAVDQTDFSVLSATATMTNGVIKNNDLSVKSPLLRIAGDGEVDLNSESIDYLLTTTIVGSLEGKGGRDMSDLKGLPIPIEVSGTFAEPKYKLRLDKAFEQAAGDELRKKADEEKAKLQKKLDKKKEKLEQKADEKKQELEDKLNKKLKGLFQ